MKSHQRMFTEKFTHKSLHVEVEKSLVKIPDFQYNSNSVGCQPHLLCLSERHTKYCQERKM